MSALASDRRTARLLVTPAILVMLAVAAYPIVAVAWLALRRVQPIFGIDEWTGLTNLRFLGGDPRFWNALANTAYFAAVSVALETALGLAIALGLRRAFPGRALVRAALLVPWAIPTAVSARLWAFMLDPERGVVNHVLGAPGLDWLGSPTLALHAAIAVDVWKTTPFVALLLLAAREAIPEDLYRAARVDGASAWATFREVTLPLMAPAIAVAALFRTLDAIRVFDAVFVLTGGGPADTTETLSIYAYRTLFQTLQVGYGSALSLATFLVTALVSFLAVKVATRLGAEVVP